MRIERLIAVASFVLAAGPFAAAAEEGVLFVLDASGSMAGRAQGESKIEAARRVLSGTLADLAPHAEVGVIAFGHRREADCRDVELLVPIASHAAHDLERAVQGLRPRGKTPITRALEAAADQVKGRPAPSSIVLVSDGQETCGGDPCARVGALRAQGLRVTVHVVGFDVTDAERRQLQCVAQAGGGAYFGAASAGELSAALAAVKQKVAPAAASAGVVVSDFAWDAEGWKVVGDVRLDRSVDPTHEGGALRAVDHATGGVWYWQAPASFLGDQRSALGRELRFRLKSTPVAKPFDAPDVVLDGPAGALVHDTPQNPGPEWTAYRVPLTPTAWKHRGSGKPATEKDLASTLSALKSLLIRGEFNTGTDSGWLDDVALGAPPE
jgi:hypothetical protein